MVNLLVAASISTYTPANAKNLRKEVAQLFVTCFAGDEVEGARALVQQGLGGVIYYDALNGHLNREYTRSLSARLQGYVGEMEGLHPLWFFVDQEGGRVQRCQDGFTKIPPMKELEGKSIGEIEAWGELIGRELLDAGIQVNLAPVVDLTRQSGWVSDRTISHDPHEVVRVADALLRGFQKAGIVGCLKHFPGIGSAEEDSHMKLPMIAQTLEELEKSHLIPFRDLNTVPMVMMAHVSISKVDPNHITTFSSIWHEYLRKNLDFQGLIVTDSLTMGAVTHEHQELKEIALHALKAGADLLLIGGRTLHGVVEAPTVQEIEDCIDYITEQASTDADLLRRVEESYQRIVCLKKAT